MLKIWDWQRGEEIASLIQPGSNDWAVTAPPTSSTLPAWRHAPHALHRRQRDRIAKPAG